MPVDLTLGGSKRDDTSKTKDNIKHGKVFSMPTNKHDTYAKLTNDKSRHLSKPEDHEKFRLAPTNESKAGLWEQAWEQVKTAEKDWQAWPQFQNVKNLSAKEEVTKVQGFAQERRDQAEKNQEHVFGTSLTYRKMCSKVANCAKKFEIVGDLVVQAEPVYSALPWTLVRFVIECAVGESETWNRMLEGTETVATHVSKYPVIEQLYAKIDSELSKALRDSLLKFYKLILSFQMHTIKYFDPDHKGRRTALGMNPVTADSIKNELQTIQQAREQVDNDIVLVDAEVTKLGIDNLVEGQASQKVELVAIKEGLKALSRDLDGDFSEAERHQQERHRDLIDMWKGPLDEMKKEAEKQKVERETNHLSAVRTWLSVANPWEDHKRAKDQRRMALGKWLADELDFKHWQSSAQSSILWLHGFAGTGKTGLVCRVIENLSETLSDVETGQELNRLAIFYCSNDKAKTGRKETFSRADPEEALRSIVSQLCTRKKDRYVAPSLEAKFEASGPGSDNQRPLDYSDCVEAIIEVSQILPITIVIDAFDECDQDRSPHLIKHLKEVISRSSGRVKVFVSTRPFPAIESDLKADPSIGVTAARNKDDVRIFIETTLDDRIKDKELLDGVVEPDLRDKIRDTLTSRAQNMFLYASLLLNQLCDRNHTNDADSIRKKLDALPENLAEMYDRIMVDIHDEKNNSQRSCRLAQDTFKWLLCAQSNEKPLGYQSILEAISPPERKADINEVLAACRTLVKKEEDTISFAHYSVREHVVKMENYKPSQCNIVATRSCLRILNRFFTVDEPTRHQLSEPEKALAEYALLYWPLHYEGIAQTDIAEHRAAINAMLRSFLLTKGHGNRHKYGVYENWFRDAQKMAEPLKGNKYLASKLDALQADPPNPLFAACVFGLEDLIARFGRELNGLNKCNEDGQNALCLAIENNKLEAVKALLSRRFPADLNLLNVLAVQQFEEWNPAKPPKVILYASALQCAAATGKLDIAEFLIEQGAHIDLVAGFLGSPLQAACLKGHGAMVDLLLRKGATPNSQGGFYGNALQAAAAGGHSDIINLLLENKPPALVSTPGGHYGSALMAAVCSGSRDAVSALLEEEANPSLRDKTHGAPLEKAASMGRAGKDVVEILLEYEAKADLLRTSDGVHILHQAAMFGMDDLVEYCLDNGCQIDLITTKKPDYNWKARFNWFPREMTPLAFACAEGHKRVVEILLGRGAPFEEDRPFSAPLWAAAYQGHADIVDLLITEFRDKHNEEETIRYMDHLPDPDAGRHFILYTAVSSGNADVVKVLLNHGAPYRSNWFLATPLHATGSFKCAATTKLLLDHHKDKKVDVCLDQRTRNGRTALFEACVNSQPDIASQILDAGANLFISNDQNRTTLQAALEFDNPKFIEKLLNKASEGGNSQRFLEFLNSRHGPTGNTALMDCAARNRLSSLILLLDRGADPLVRNNENVTALHFACRQGNPSLVKRLMDKAREVTDQAGFSSFINQQPSSHMTAMIDCAANNNLQAFILLLEQKADYTLHGHFGNTPLLWASGKGHYEIVAALVKHAKTEDKESCPFQDFINHKNRDGIGALFGAANGNHRRIVSLLLDEGIDWSLANNAGVTALHAASWEGHTEVVSTLLAKVHGVASSDDFKSFLNRRNEQGKTALSDAAEKGRIEIVRELLETYEADLFVFENKKCSALGLACWFGHIEVVSFLLKFASTKLPRDRFVEYLNHRNEWGKTAFMDAAESGRLGIAEMLLEPQYGANYRIPNDLDVTPLQAPVWNGHKEVTELILKTASRDLPPDDFQNFLNHRNKWGKTAFMDAADRGRLQMVEKLLEPQYAADYRIPNTNDVAPLQISSWNGHSEVAALILKTASRNLPPADFQTFLNRRNKWGKTILIDAAERNLPDTIALLLDDYSADYSLADTAGFTALHYSAFRNHLPAVRALLERASKDDKNKTGNGDKFTRFLNRQSDTNRATALRDAASRSHVEVVRYILRYNPAYDAVDDKKRTAMHHAVERSDGPLGMVLLDHASKDADKERFKRFVNARDEKGETVWEGVKRRGSMPRFAEKLRACGVVEGL